MAPASSVFVYTPQRQSVGFYAPHTCKFRVRVYATEAVDPVLRINETVAILVEEGKHCVRIVLCSATHHTIRRQ